MICTWFGSGLGPKDFFKTNKKKGLSQSNKSYLLLVGLAAALALLSLRFELLPKDSALSTMLAAERRGLDALLGGPAALAVGDVSGAALPRLPGLKTRRTAEDIDVTKSSNLRAKISGTSRDLVHHSPSDSH